MQSYAVLAAGRMGAGAVIAYPLGPEDVSISCELSAKFKQTGGRQYFQGHFQQIAPLELADAGLKIETARTDIQRAAMAGFGRDGADFPARYSVLSRQPPMPAFVKSILHVHPCVDISLSLSFVKPHIYYRSNPHSRILRRQTTHLNFPKYLKHISLCESPDLESPIVAHKRGSVFINVNAGMYFRYVEVILKYSLATRRSLHGKSYVSC